MDCNVCLENLFSKTVVSTSCGHLHHQDCLNRWFQNTKICPNCRSDQRNETPIQIFFPLSSNDSLNNPKRSVNIRDVVEQVLNSTHNYKKKMEEVENLLEIEKNRSYEYIIQINKLENDVVLKETYKNENLRLIQENKNIQLKLNCANKYKNKLEENEKLLEIEKQLSLEYKFKIEKLNDEVKLNEIIREENIRLYEENEKIILELSSSEEYIRQIEQLKKNLKLEKTRSSEFRNQLENLNKEIKYKEIVIEENLRLAKNNKDIQLKLNCVDQYKKKMEENEKLFEMEKKRSYEYEIRIECLFMETERIKSIWKKNIQLHEEKKKVKSKLNLEVDKSLWLKKKRSSEYEMQINDLFDEIKKMKTIWKEDTQFVETKKKEFISKLKLEVDEPLRLEKKRSYEYQIEIKRLQDQIKFGEMEKLQLIKKNKIPKSKNKEEFFKILTIVSFYSLKVFVSHLF